MIILKISIILYHHWFSTTVTSISWCVQYLYWFNNIMCLSSSCHLQSSHPELKWGSVFLCSNWMMDPCISPVLYMLINNRQENIMQTPYVCFIISVQKSLFFHWSEQVIKQTETTTKHISPKSLNPLIMSAFTYNIDCLFGSMYCTDKLGNILYVSSHKFHYILYEK